MKSPRQRWWFWERGPSRWSSVPVFCPDARFRVGPSGPRERERETTKRRYDWDEARGPGRILPSIGCHLFKEAELMNRQFFPILFKNNLGGVWNSCTTTGNQVGKGLEHFSYLAEGESLSTRWLMERWRQEQRRVPSSTRGGSPCSTAWRTRNGWVNEWPLLPYQISRPALRRGDGADWDSFNVVRRLWCWKGFLGRLMHQRSISQTQAIGLPFDEHLQVRLHFRACTQVPCVPRLSEIERLDSKLSTGKWSERVCHIGGGFGYLRRVTHADLHRDDALGCHRTHNRIERLGRKHRGVCEVFFDALW